MTTILPVRKTCYCAVCAALCVILPMAFHSFPDGGRIFLPMHIPVLLCGLTCGGPWGLLCGLAGPILSSMLTGMPGAPVLPGMLVECGVYGLCSGCLFHFIRTGHLLGDLYISMTASMLLGRLLSGLAKALIFTPGLSLQAWATASFVTGLPGIVIQLVLLPLLVKLLMKNKALPERY